MSTAAIVGGTIAGAGIGAVGSSLAAGAQSDAAKSAAGLQFKLGEDQLNFNKQQYNTTQAQLAPFLKAGTSGINELSALLAKPGAGLLTPFTGQFQPPTAAQAAATPGYQFTAGAGTGAIENSAAGAGNLLSTGTLKTLDQFNQGLASTTYSDTYNRAFNQYLQQYNQFQNNQTNEFNRLAAISGIGQTAGSTLASSGSSAAGIGGSIAANTGAQIGGSTIFGGGANASGYAGIANALQGGIGGINQYLMLNSILNRPGAMAGPTPPATPPILGVPG